MVPLTLSGIGEDVFSPDYASARQGVLRAADTLASRLPVTHDTWSAPGLGPAGEVLTTDILWIGDRDASRVLTLISGTHGVEGFAGSAIQRDILGVLPELPSDTACLVIHALNPHGFAWWRRCDGDGIDLNRNFVDFDASLPVNGGYEQLADALLQRGCSVEAANATLADFLERHGREVYEKAVSGGQYTDLDGLFFGGRAPSVARRHLEDFVSLHALKQRTLAVIDVHTGLGPFGHGEIISDHPSRSVCHARARRWYGEIVTSPDEGTSTSVPKHGLLDYFWHGLMGERGCFVTLEFGTYPVGRMLAVLRDDHILHARGAVDWHDPATVAVKSAIRAQFDPQDRDWRLRVLFQGRLAFNAALQGVLHDG